ncbi:MAG: hypothetical protein IJL38_05045 [Bacteroidales bacterium]|nr:hypothetical protein [Bacteroidales bacterium]
MRRFRDSGCGSAGTTLIRFNRDNPEPYIEDLPRFTAFTEDIASILNLT